MSSRRREAHSAINSEVFLQRLQILSIPPAARHLTVQVRAHIFWKPFMFHGEASSLTLRLQLECDDRIHSLRPYLYSPRLNDPLIGKQFYVPPGDHAAETRKPPSLFLLDLRRGAAGKSAELFRI